MRTAKISKEDCNLTVMISSIVLQVYYMRTVNITDHIPVYCRYPVPDDKLSTAHSMEIILEPMQKWTCPDNLVSAMDVQAQFSPKNMSYSLQPSDVFVQRGSKFSDRLTLIHITFVSFRWQWPRHHHHGRTGHS